MAQWGDTGSYDGSVYGDGMGNEDSLRRLSPYALDPSYLPKWFDRYLNELVSVLKEPEYIFPVDSKKRSLGDRMLPITGQCYLLGIGVGGTWGLYEGLLAVPTGESRRLKLNTVINSCTRRGPFLANNLAVLGIMYSTTNHILSRITEQEDSVLTSVAAGTLTGVIYKSTAGVRAILMAGSVGAGIIAVMSVGQYLYNNRYKFVRRYNAA